MVSVRGLTFAAVGLAAVAVAPSAHAQRPRTNARVWVNGEEVRPSELIGNRRARLGVTVDIRKNENDQVGATIKSVTPGGPAAKAGLRSGDIIVKLDGKALNTRERTLRERQDDAEEEPSLPGLRLIELAAKLEPNDTISIEYRRGEDTKTIQLVTGNERFGGNMFAFGGPEGEGWKFPVEGMSTPGMPRLKTFFRGNGPEPSADWLTFGGAFADLELAPLNADLGGYFGTAEGVLVIDVPAKSSLGLKGGDVILSVDGRKPSGPGSLLRILNTYEPGDAVKLEIMRNKSRQTITSKIDKED